MIDLNGGCIIGRRVEYRAHDGSPMEIGRIMAVKISKGIVFVAVERGTTIAAVAAQLTWPQLSVTKLHAKRGAA